MAGRAPLSGGRGRRGEGARLRLGVLLVGSGLVAGALLGLHVRGAIPPRHESSSPASAAAAEPPRANVAPGVCLGDCLDRDLGYSWASAVGVADAEGCAALRPALRRGCLDYLRDRGVRGAPRR